MVLVSTIRAVAAEARKLIAAEGVLTAVLAQQIVAQIVSGNDLELFLQIDFVVTLA